MRRSSALALAALLQAAIACPGAAPDLGPRLDAVEPAFGDLGGPTSVLIRGQFRVGAVQALSEASADAVDATYQAWLDGAPLGQVRWLDERTLAAVVPGGLVEGPHRLDVQDPTGRRGTLAGAFFARVPTVGAAPTVTLTLPANGATGVPLDLPISASFSQAMDPATLSATTFTVKQGTTNVSGAVTVNGAAPSATFTPASPLGQNLPYTATITTGAKDSGGRALAANYGWSFTTAASAGPPTVISTNPLDLATNICIPPRVDATFDKLMDPLTINLTNFTLAGPGTSPVSGTVSYDGQTSTASFLPASSLVAGTKYTATVSTGVKDAAGNGLALDKIWTFTPSATLCTQPINLRGISSYSVASRAGLTSTGVTVVNGNVALYPLATCTDATGNAGASRTCLVKTYVSPTGMTVNGSIYFAADPFDDGVTAKAVTDDLNSAWIEGKAKAVTNGTVAGDELSGKTFNAGVYNNANLGLAANGVATMDAQNDLNAVFIFQVGSSMTDSGTLLLPTQIKLVNGAQAKSIYFVVGLDVTIGSGTIWNGTILAGRTVTVNDGSTVNGRVLAGASGAGAFTLTGAASPSKTTITVPR